MNAVLRVAALLLTRCGAWHLVRHTTPLQLRAASDAVDASAEALAALRVPELKDKCRARGLRVSGTKALLIERLLEVDGADANAAEEGSEADGADANAANVDATGAETTSNAAEEGSWASLGLDEDTQQRLEHATPTPIQAAAFQALKNGKDGVLHAETGSGKTLAYALPLMKKRVLVLTPSTSLADQIASVVDQFSESFMVHTPKEVLKAEDDLDAIDVIVLDEVDALLRAPGRYAAAEQKKFRRERPAAKILRRFIQRRPDAQVIGASATVGRPLRRHIDDILRDAAPSNPRSPINVIRGTEPPVNGRAVTAPSTLKHVISSFWDRGPGEPDLEALRTALDSLNAARPLVVVNDGDPDRVQRFLKKSGYDIDVLAPNEIRGLDRDVDVVLSLGRPATCDDYLHVAGRTARAGGSGLCCTLAAHRDAKAVAAFASPLDIVFETVEDAGELGKYRM